MNQRRLDKICFTICTVSIVVGSALSLAMIWGEIRDNELVWKSWLTAVVFFLASGLVLSVSKTFGGGRAENQEGDEGGANRTSQTFSRTSAPTDVGL